MQEDKPTNIKQRKKPNKILVACLIIFLVLFIITGNFLYFFFNLNEIDEIWISKAVFNQDRSSYEIEPSNLKEFLFNHPIEGYRNCKIWEYPNGYDRVFEKSTTYSCSILKYDDIIFIFEVKEK